MAAAARHASAVDEAAGAEPVAVAAPMDEVTTTGTVLVRVERPAPPAEVVAGAWIWPSEIWLTWAWTRTAVKAAVRRKDFMIAGCVVVGVAW